MSTRFVPLLSPRARWFSRSGAVPSPRGWPHSDLPRQAPAGARDRRIHLYCTRVSHNRFGTISRTTCRLQNQKGYGCDGVGSDEEWYVSRPGTYSPWGCSSRSSLSRGVPCPLPPVEATTPDRRSTRRTSLPRSYARRCSPRSRRWSRTASTAPLNGPSVAPAARTTPRTLPTAARSSRRRRWW